MTTTFTATILPEKMGGGGDLAPIEIGARGTVGNLVMKEIEYFKRLEAGNHGGDRDHCKCSINSSSNTNEKHGGGGSKFWPSFGFLNISWRKSSKRKGGGSGRFLPRMCTIVDVADNRHLNHHRLNKIPSFSYRNLKDDINQFDV